MDDPRVCQRRFPFLGHLTLGEIASLEEMAGRRSRLLPFERGRLDRLLVKRRATRLPLPLDEPPDAA